MNKLYLLSLSLLVWHPGFATEEAVPLDEPELVSYEESLKVKRPIRRHIQRARRPVQEPQAAEEKTAAEEPQKKLPKFNQTKAPEPEVEEADVAEAVQEEPQQYERKAQQRYTQRKGALKAQIEQEEVKTEQPAAPKKQRPAVRRQIPAVEQPEVSINDEEQPVEQVKPRARTYQRAKAPAKEVVQYDEEQEPVQQKPAPRVSQKRTTAQANSASSKRVAQNNNQPMAQPSPKKMNYNTAARPVVKEGFNFFLMGDVLLWQAVEENLTYAYTSNPSLTNNTNLHTVDFDWDWGVRLGAGYNAPRDGWDIDLYWTHMNNHASGSNSGSGLSQVFGDADFPFPGTPTYASAHWHVTLDQIDLELGRQFWVGKHLTVRPFVGMRTAWIHQKERIYLSDATVSQQMSLKNRYWGYGFAAGMDSDWKLGWGFSLYGSADMAVLLGFFHVNQTGTEDSASIWSQMKSFRAGRAIFDVDMGLKWSSLFCNDGFGLTLKLGYEYHLYFNQNQFLVSNGSTDFELFNPVQGDLAFQGVIGSIQFDF